MGWRLAVGGRGGEAQAERRLPAGRYAGILPAGLSRGTGPAGSRRSGRQDAGAPRANCPLLFEGMPPGATALVAMLDSEPERH